MLKPDVLLELIRHFTVFEKARREDQKTGQVVVETIKKVAAYHQYYVVNKAIESTARATGERGGRKIGVVWHTQGSGKSLSMVFYAGKAVLALDNPTIVVITDRNDLDDQLFDTFSASRGLLRQTPTQAGSRAHLKELLQTAGGKIVFTTIQKFFPADGGDTYDLLSERKNIVVIADEAHRSQYGFAARTVFKDEEVEAIAEGVEFTAKEKAKAKWAQLEAIVGNRKRLKEVARDLVKHFEARQEVFIGKAMILAMSRRIAVELYEEIVALRPDWHSNDLDKGVIKVVMTASSSAPKEFQPHHPNKETRRRIADRFKDPENSLKLVVVQSMWLTGFDVPSLHKICEDKLMRGHNLMQAIARVNRVFRDKPAGLVVDYIGFAADLQRALAVYVKSGGKGDTALTQEKAVEVMLEKYEVVKQILHGFDYHRYFAIDTKGKLGVILEAQEYILEKEKKEEKGASGKEKEKPQSARERFMNEVT